MQGEPVAGGFRGAGRAVRAGGFPCARNASWSDDAWGYLLLPMGTPVKGDVVIFEPPESLGAEVPYLKRVLGQPGESVSVDGAGRVSVDGVSAALPNRSRWTAGRSIPSDP